ncbi:MAG: uridine phosphorylase [Clostridia bacterium]|nr:uridine phosphorylase [Clostridia bacterium]
MNEEKLFHIGISRSQRAEYAVLPGDPARVEKIARYLDNAEFLAQNREFTSYAGELCGKRVIVMSTGIGGPSAAIALEELAMSGLKTAVRVGTCGGIQEKVMSGDLVIANAAVRMEGTSKEYMPIEFPAVSDFSVTSALAKSAEMLGYRYHVGVVQSKDSFYGQHSPESMPVGYELENKWNAWKQSGVLASEMETAALFTVGAVRKIKMGCVLHSLWNQERKKLGYKDKDDFDTDMAVKTAVNALKILINGDMNG